jgi:hypothetical protein
MGLGTTLGMPDNLSELEAMWCLQFPFFCSTATVQASQALMTPGLVYSPVSPLPAPSAPADPSNPSVDAAIAAANAQGQANFQNTIDQTAANLAAAGGNDPNNPTSGMPTWLWWVLGGGLALAVVWPSGGPRIYGR